MYKGFDETVLRVKALSDSLVKEWNKAKITGLYGSGELNLRAKFELLKEDSSTGLKVLWEYCDNERAEIKRDSMRFGEDGIPK